MASFRILNQAPQYLLPDGSVNSGGKLFFYETDLTTPKNTWSDEAMAVLNPNPVIMDAAGRTLTDVWGDGEYGVRMTTSSNVIIWTRNNVKASADPGSEIPALLSGQFLSNNGSVLLWQPILQVPDPTGHADEILFSDGALAYWGPAPTVPELPSGGVSNTSTSFRIGNLLLQAGSGVVPPSGLEQASTSVTFATPFSGAPVSVQMQMGLGDRLYSTAVYAVSATGFSCTIGTNFISHIIITPQTFTYTAIGPVTP